MIWQVKYTLIIKCYNFGINSCLLLYTDASTNGGLSDVFVKEGRSSWIRSLIYIAEDDMCISSLVCPQVTSVQHFQMDTRYSTPIWQGQLILAQHNIFASSWQKSNPISHQWETQSSTDNLSWVGFLTPTTNLLHWISFSGCQGLRNPQQVYGRSVVIDCFSINLPRCAKFKLHGM